MKKYKIITFLFSLLLIPQIINSQNWNNGLTISYGISKITNHDPDNYQTKISPFSLKFGGFFERKINSNSNLGLEILWVQMEGKAVDENAEILLYVAGEYRTLGTGTRTQYLHLSYLGIPLYYKYKFEKLSLRGGVQPMVLIIGASHSKFVGERGGQPYSNKTKWSGAGVKRIDVGSLIGLEYKLNRRISLKTEFYFGLVDLSGKSQSGARNRQFSIGINYTRK